MHADSFLFIVRVAASINQALSTIFSVFSANLHTSQQLKLALCPFFMSRSIIWPSGGLMRTIGEKVVKTTSTFSARKKSPDSIFFEIFYENKFLKDVKICQKIIS